MSEASENRALQLEKLDVTEGYYELRWGGLHRFNSLGNVGSNGSGVGKEEHMICEKQFTICL